MHRHGCWSVLTVPPHMYKVNAEKKAAKIYNKSWPIFFVIVLHPDIGRNSKNESVMDLLKWYTLH